MPSDTALKKSPFDTLTTQILFSQLVLGIMSRGCTESTTQRQIVNRLSSQRGLVHLVMKAKHLDEFHEETASV